MDKESIEKTVKETPWTPGNDGTAHGSVAGGEMRRHQTSPGIIYRMTVATIIAAVTLVLALALCGCTTTTKYVPVERVTHHTDTVRELAVRIDSVMTRDSVAVYMSGDTVYLTKWRDRFRYSERIDTVYRSVADSIRVPQPYPVERKLTAWEQVKQDAGGWAMAALTVLLPAAAWIIGRRMRKPR